jgi:large subunit ribosomal protein L4
MATTTKSTAVKTTLPKEIFAVEVKNHELLKMAYDSYLANSRKASATTLQRGEVRGGGKKPWKQKGTGRARFGSSRNPIWRGGGIVFGPRGNENYKIKMTTSSKRVAIRQALSLSNKAKKLFVLDFKATGKAADTAKFLADNKLDRKVLLVVDEKTPLVMRSTNNIQNILLIRANYLNVYHILNADNVVLTPAAVEVVKAWLSKEEK